MEQRAVIDETFAGLVTPVQTFEMGRPDLEGDRPGSILVSEVQKFAADGGFERIAEGRDAERTRGEAIDAAARRPRMVHEAVGGPQDAASFEDPSVDR